MLARDQQTPFLLRQQFSLCLSNADSGCDSRSRDSILVSQRLMQETQAEEDCAK